MLKSALQPIKTSRSLSARPFSWDRTQGMAGGMGASEATAHLGGHLLPRLAPCFSQFQRCDSGAENQASSARCW